MKGNSPPPDSPSEDLEELENEAILAQQSAAHAPQRRQQVRMESQSVVISDAPSKPAAAARSRRPRSAEPTLVIRDRRRLDEIRRSLAQRQAAVRRRRWLVVFAAVSLAALLVGGSVALLVKRSRSGMDVEVPATLPGPAPAPLRAEDEELPIIDLEEMPEAPAQGADVPSQAAAPSSASPTRITGEDPDTVAPVKLEELPVEK